MGLELCEKWDKGEYEYVIAKTVVYLSIILVFIVAFL